MNTMKEWHAGGRKTRRNKRMNKKAIAAEALALMPPMGPVRQQVEMQLAFLTQNMMAATVRANRIPPPAEPDPDLQPVRQGNRWVTPSPSDQSAYRIAELQEAARMSFASARLVAALGRLRVEFRQHHTVSRVTTIENPQTHKRSVTSWNSSFDAPSPHSAGFAPPDISPDLAEAAAVEPQPPPPPENGGSNAGA
jgi:hypothetical protein